MTTGTKTTTKDCRMHTLSNAAIAAVIIVSYGGGVAMTWWLTRRRWPLL